MVRHRQMPENMEARAKRRWWVATRRLAGFALVVLLSAAIGIPLFAPSLPDITVLGIPLGFFLAAQGVAVAMVVLAFWIAARQDAIDHRYGLSEDD